MAYMCLGLVGFLLEDLPDFLILICSPLAFNLRKRASSCLRVLSIKALKAESSADGLGLVSSGLDERTADFFLGSCGIIIIFTISTKIIK